MTAYDLLKDPDLNLRREDHPVSNEIHLSTEPDRLPDIVSLLKTRYQARLITMFANDEREIAGVFRLYAVLTLPGEDCFLILKVPVPSGRAEFPSLTPVLPAAHWYEREIRDLFGMMPLGHPDLRRLILHEDWPEGSYPLRKDFDLRTSPPRVAGAFSFRQVEGEGVFEIPVGPVHAGIIEPGHFRFSSVGEVVFLLECRLGYKHRGMEKIAETLPIDRLPELAERISGTSSVSHAVAACQAIERASGVEIPDQAALLRTLYMEMERLYNHIGDIGNLCAGTGLSYGLAAGSILKEHLLQLHAQVFQNRFLRGLCCPGGVKRGLTQAHREIILQTLDRVEDDFRSLVQFLLTSSSHLDRLETTGKLEKTVAEDLGVVGVAARASGIDRDTRRDHPHAAYGRIPFQVVTRTDGDVLARALVRIDEANVSFDILRSAIDRLDDPEEKLFIPMGEVPAYRSAFGYVETPRGQAVHFLMTGPNQTVFRYKVRTPSYCNWPAMPFLFQGNIIPDFPLCNKSLNLSYAGADL